MVESWVEGGKCLSGERICSILMLWQTSHEERIKLWERLSFLNIHKKFFLALRKREKREGEEQEIYSASTFILAFPIVFFNGVKTTGKHNYDVPIFW